jgi:hypothetical protein
MSILRRWYVCALVSVATAIVLVPPDDTSLISIVDVVVNATVVFIGLSLLMQPAVRADEPAGEIDPQQTTRPVRG